MGACYLFLLLPSSPFLLDVSLQFTPSEVVAHFCISLQLSAIDVSARTTMKGAANCDKHCELQNSVNQ
jgi:hypothetical protein